MKDTIYISGHKNPDADSICSAIGYAYFKNTINDKNYIPIRLGKINPETKFILDYFNVPEPMFLETIKLKVSDLEYNKITSITPDFTIKKAGTYLADNNIDYISVTDDKNKLCGMLTISNLNKIYTTIWGDNILYDSKTTIENIIETLDATAICINEKCQYFPGKIWIAAMSVENIKRYVHVGDIVIIGDREDVLDALIDIKVSLIIITGGSKINDDILFKACSTGITVISTKNDTLSTTSLLYLSIPVSYVMAKDNIISFDPDDLVRDIKSVMIKNRYRAYPIVDSSNNVYGMISRYNLLSKDRKKIIQVDHNEFIQAIDGIEEAEIVEVIDHHRVTDIQSSYPIFLRNEPVGSTSTIVAEMFIEHNVPLDASIAGILMSGIISDTLIFKSPTCTKTDIDYCNRLASIAGIKDLNAYAYEMQKAATSLKGRTVEDIFETDFKEFKIGNYLVGISQLNTIDFSTFDQIKNEVIQYMENKQKSEKYDLLMLALTNVIDEESMFIPIGDTQIFEHTFDVNLVDNKAFIKGILSRKKQIVPALSKFLLEDNSI